MSTRRLVFLVSSPALLIGLGALGLHLLEGFPWFESVYLAVITLTTVGYGDLTPTTEAGRAFVILLALGGIFTIAFTATEVMRAIVSGEVQSTFGRRRLEQNLANLRDHYIICGYGRMGRLVCQHFSRERLPFVVIEHQSDPSAPRPEVEGGLYLPGDATADETLRRAGVERAKALVSVVGADADNLYITMSARLLNERLFIIARCETEASEQKLVRAGANRVVSPYVLGGARVAQAALRPNVVDFIDLATSTDHLELQIEETAIAPKSSLAGFSLKQSPLLHSLRLIIVAVRKPGGQMLFNPDPSTKLEAGDTLIALGPRPKLNELERLARG